MGLVGERAQETHAQRAPGRHARRAPSAEDQRLEPQHREDPVLGDVRHLPRAEVHHVELPDRRVGRQELQDGQDEHRGLLRREVRRAHEHDDREPERGDREASSTHLHHRTLDGAGLHAPSSPKRRRRQFPGGVAVSLSAAAAAAAFRKSFSVNP